MDKKNDWKWGLIKLNWQNISFTLQMEDECSIGNDETRIFILSSYASNKMNRVPCVLCKTMLHIFDRYPLLDGTFFLLIWFVEMRIIDAKFNTLQNVKRAEMKFFDWKFSEKKSWQILSKKMLITFLIFIRRLLYIHISLYL